MVLPSARSTISASSFSFWKYSAGIGAGARKTRIAAGCEPAPERRYLTGEAAAAGCPASSSRSGRWRQKFAKVEPDTFIQVPKINDASAAAELFRTS
jgi:hypothetical protein